MPLLKPKHRRRASSWRLREFTTLRCALNGHQVSWCRELCEPVDGNGICGRIAPHAMVGRTQAAIARYQEQRRKKGS